MLQDQTYRRYFDTLFNHLLINEAGGRTLENIYGGGRLKAKLRKNSHSCKRVIFYKKFGYNAPCHW